MSTEGLNGGAGWGPGGWCCRHGRYTTRDLRIVLVERDEGGAGPNESVFATDFLKETFSRKPLFHVQKTTLFITNLVLNNGQFNISKLCGHWLECFQDGFPFPFSWNVIFFAPFISVNIIWKFLRATSYTAKIINAWK